MSICYVLRGLSFLVTNLPSPAPHCQIGSNEYNPPKSLNLQMITQIDIQKGCGDLIFSGHTCSAFTFVISAFVYGKYLLPCNLQSLCIFFCFCLFFCYAYTNCFKAITQIRTFYVSTCAYKLHINRYLPPQKSNRHQRKQQT